MSQETETLNRGQFKIEFTNDTGKQATGLKVEFKQGCTPQRGSNRLFGNFDQAAGVNGSNEHEFTDGTVNDGDSIDINFNTTSPKLTVKKETWLFN
ncbi:MAG: hypothetical protein ACRBHB_25780 [Arenicella sp.]